MQPFSRLGRGPALVAASIVLGSTAFAQTDRVPFPLQDAQFAAPIGVGERTLTTDLAGVASLMAHDSVTMTGFPMPDGSAVTLELQRIDVERRKFGVHVNGQLDKDALDDLDLTVWRGKIEGDEVSDVMLGFSRYGSRGWVRTRTELVHLLAQSHDDGSWLGAPGLVTTEGSLNAGGFINDVACDTAPPAVAPTPSLGQTGGGAGTLDRAIDSISFRECPIAMETDWQYYQLFNDLNAATTYATTLLSFVSNRYEVQTSTVLTFPYLQIYTTSNDPWSSPDNGGSSIDMLNEFVAAWQGNVPMNATLGHFMSGASLGGGVAYLDVLCNNNFNFGVSGNIQNIVNFPVVQQPNNWDFMVIAHELGHNFAAPHTHDFCPPLDECPPSQYFGACQNQQTCTNMGTIMSYCHLCPGGTANITTWFHPEEVLLMRAASENCNNAVFEVIANAPDQVSENSSTPTTLSEVVGTLDDADMFYSTNGGATYTQVAMTEGAGGVWTAAIPPVSCDADVDIYFSFTATGLGAFTAPVDAPNNTYAADVGTQVTLFGDDFETDTGWAPVNLGASTGDWQRGVPVNDPNWSYDPASDFDGSGSCYLTENVIGNTDVDGGAVELTSPTFDMSAPGAAVSYAYYLRLTNSDGDDRMLVEARNGGGAFTEITRHDTDGGSAWRTVSLSGQDFINAGVMPGSSMQMRFTVNDADTQSIVEAGLDAFTVSFIDCGGPGTTYCSPANANSTGNPATIRADGSNVAADNDITLTAESLPNNSTGYFLTSTTQGFVGNAGGSSGNLCVVGDIGRYVGNVLNSGGTGTFALTLDLTMTPHPSLGLISVNAGDTWNYQAWFRDAIGGTPTSNFTDAVSILYQ